MIYTIVGTEALSRQKALTELTKLGAPTVHLYGESVGDIERYIEASSLFGDSTIAHVVQALERAEGRDRVYELLPRMQASDNIFIIDEPFADANRTKKLEKFSHKLFDAREEKRKELSPFPFTDAFAKRDKKKAWLELMAIRDHLDPEAIQGALWWKFQTVWVDAISARQGIFSQEECAIVGKKILASSILAHRGELDLSAELERITLSL